MNKKLILVLIPFYLFLTPVCAQNWGPVGTGTNESVRALCVYNGDLYAGGYFTMAGGNPANCIAQWNGTIWSTVSTGVTGGSNYPEILSMAVYNGNLYAAGRFTTAGGNPASNIAMWNGSAWSAVGTGIAGTNSFVTSLAVYNGKLVAAGYFSIAGAAPANSVASWNGTTWATLGSGLSIVNGSAFTMYAYDSVLYVAGDFDSAGGHICMSIAQWNGTTWAALGAGTLSSLGYPGYVNTLCVYNRKLYAGGTFDTAGGLAQNDFACWNGTAWDSAGINSLNLNGVPYCSLVSNGKLYLGGSINTADGKPVHNITSWNGTLWDSVGSGFAGDTGVFSLCVYNNELYAGGIFLMSGNTATSYIAKWNHPLGIDELSSANKNDVKLYPNPNNGVFTVEVKSEELRTKSTIEIYNMLGEKLYSGRLISINTEIDLTDKPSGIYLYRLVSQSGEPIASGKFIIQ
jgi:hypothetical protein